jgi:hypothetical protein
MKRSISTTYVLGDFGEFDDHTNIAHSLQHGRNSPQIRRGRQNAGITDEPWWRYERNFNKSETASEDSVLFETKVPKGKKGDKMLPERAIGRPRVMT